MGEEFDEQLFRQFVPFFKLKTKWGNKTVVEGGGSLVVGKK